MAAGPTQGTQILRSPREASSIYALSGAKGPRQHHMFAVCFHKAGTTTTGSTGTTTTTTTGNWQKDMSFVIKNIDRPQIEPRVEEVNQYNKKRLITTGYKIGPTRMTIYDTADSTGMQMVNEYMKYYFGDFRHGTSATTDWNSDTTQNTINGASNGDFGFAPQAASNGASEFNQQFFFDSVSVYQVYGGKFVQYDLIKPKIVAVNPDEMDYTNAEVSTITLSLQCEAIIYVNDFQPQPVSADSFLSEAFGNTSEFKGDVYDYPANDATDPTTTNNYTAASQPAPDVGALLSASSTLNAAVPTLQTADTGVSSGSLTAYGQYNFGSTTAAAYTTQPSQSLSADLSQAALTNPTLLTALTLVSKVNGQNNSNPVLPSVYVAPSVITQDTLEQATAAVQAAGLQSGALAGTDFSSALTYGAISAAAASGYGPREMVYNRGVPAPPPAYALNGNNSVKQYSPIDTFNANPIAAVSSDGSTTVATAQPGQVVNSWNSASGQGIALSPYAYGVVNSQRVPSAQIGFNARTATAYQNRFGQPGYTYPKNF